MIRSHGRWPRSLSDSALVFAVVRDTNDARVESGKVRTLRGKPELFNLSASFTEG
jgi:hypothetical protein